ncbi:protein TIFY 10b-like [Curcuma longa]|uniref:protein TIFY 10b-like n=1 Tax=Curcuma longa TaxID=136217 RepID=UPI003D9EF3F0
MVEEKMGSKEESSFSRTCRLLSRYLREKGSLGGLPPLDRKPQDKSREPKTINLFPGVDVLEETHTQINQEKTSQKSMALYPQQSTQGPANALETKQMEMYQLTIFYAGEVLVFNNYPADRAKDLMQMASKGSFAAQSFSFSTPRIAAAGAECTSKPETKLAQDMPIMRRNSLHRFLEKRKDRIHSKAPYQGNPPSSVNAAKPESSEPWLNLGRQISDHSSDASK